ncbi:MAG: hypothetical protein R3300_10735 [Candidatus Promineifilaceae bacterium]|nr:hypothetical protein [Candidatus Promineifilaceae bacterium]
MSNQAVADIARRWRAPLLALWILIAGIYLLIFVADLQLGFDLLSEPCLGGACHYQALGPAEALALSELGFSLTQYAAYMMGLAAVVTITYVGLGGLILWRRSHQRAGLAVSLLLVVFPISLISSFDIVAAAYPELTWLVLSLAIVASAATMLAILTFPDGRLVPRWSAFLVVTWLLSTGPEQLGADFGFLQVAAGFLTLVAVSTVVIYRYRKVFSSSERQQAKWALFGFAALLLATVIWTVTYEIGEPPAGQPRLLLNVSGQLVSNLLALAVPITLTISILRYRLWDIDQLIRRTVAYGLLTTLLIALYFGSVIVIQQAIRALTGQESPLAIVLSTLIIAALFNPLRNRVQETIDRRFFRRRYDAAQALARFNMAARDEVDLDELTAALMSVVDETMQPDRTLLWLQEPSEH